MPLKASEAPEPRSKRATYERGGLLLCRQARSKRTESANDEERASYEQKGLERRSEQGAKDEHRFPWLFRYYNNITPSAKREGKLKVFRGLF